MKVFESGILGMVCLYALPVFADHHEAGEIEAKIRQMMNNFNQGKFEAGFAPMVAGTSAYLPHGLLKEMPPGDAGKQAIVKIYEDRFEKGYKSTVTPQHIKIAVRGDTAIATFLVDGMATTPHDTKPQPILGRESHVWQKLDEQWRLVHVHMSDLKRGPN